jgi:hypothetical protein
MELAPVPPRILISAGVAIATAISGWLASKNAKPSTAAHSEFGPLDDLPAIIGRPEETTGASRRETLARRRLLVLNASSRQAALIARHVVRALAHRMSVANASFTISLISLSLTAFFTYQFMLEV